MEDFGVFCRRGVEYINIMASAKSTKMAEGISLDGVQNGLRMRQQEYEINYLNKIIEVKDVTLSALHKMFNEETNISKQNLETCKEVAKLIDQQIVSPRRPASSHSSKLNIKGLVEGLAYEYASCYQREQTCLIHWHD